jgi:hypothetical protein
VGKRVDVVHVVLVGTDGAGEVIVFADADGIVRRGTFSRGNFHQTQETSSALSVLPRRISPVRSTASRSLSLGAGPSWRTSPSAERNQATKSASTNAEQAIFKQME